MPLTSRSPPAHFYTYGYVKDIQTGLFSNGPNAP
jgi:hypothetical protein